MALVLWRLGRLDEAKSALRLPTRNSKSWCRERNTGQATRSTAWWYDGPQLFTLRREAHEQENGHAPDDAPALARVQTAMGDLFNHAIRPPGPTRWPCAGALERTVQQGPRRQADRARAAR